jgi:hypothetical protein
LWEEDKKLKAARARAVAKASKKGWSAIQDTQDSNAAVSSTGIAQAPVPTTATTSPPATWSKKDNTSEAKSTVEGASAEERPVEAEAAVTPSATSAAIPAQAANETPLPTSAVSEEAGVLLAAPVVNDPDTAAASEKDANSAEVLQDVSVEAVGTAGAAAE